MDVRCGFGCVVLSAGLSGVLSFSLLVVAIATEYWYIIEDERANFTQHLHSGLWGVKDDVPPFSVDSSGLSESERHMQTMHDVIAILLPLSLVLLVFGGICGLASSLARSRVLLIGTASYVLLCSLLTSSGLSLYVSYSDHALEDAEKRIGAEQMALVRTSFGWSMSLAWISFILEVMSAFLLLLAAWMSQLTQYQETVAPI